VSDLHKHHRRRRSQGGDDSWGNIIELPADVHELVHREPGKAYEHGLLVKSHDDPAQIRPDIAGFLADLGVEWQEAKPKRSRLKGAARAARKSVSVRLPEGVDGEYWDELLNEAESVELEQPDTQFDKTLGKITTGKLLVTVLERFTGRV